MKTVLRIIQIFRARFLYSHLWNSSAGKYEYLIRDLLYNPRLLGSSKSDVRHFMRFYRLCSHEPEEWIYEIRSIDKRKYLLILQFEKDKLINIKYSYLKK